MDILGIGTDIIECPRIGKMIEQHGELFLRRVYTDREIRYCQSRKHAIEHFAGRWAAKEAILKAIGHRLEPGDRLDRHRGPQPARRASPGSSSAAGPRRPPSRRGIGDILVSISHCRTYATAYALALGPSANGARPAGTRPPGRRRTGDPECTRRPSAVARGLLDGSRASCRSG